MHNGTGSDLNLTLMVYFLLNIETTESVTECTPRVIMLSSAGVTRPRWSDEKKTKLVGCADIPIVRLNPVGFVQVVWNTIVRNPVV